MMDDEATLRDLDAAMHARQEPDDMHRLAMENIAVAAKLLRRDAELVQERQAHERTRAEVARLRSALEPFTFPDYEIHQMALDDDSVLRVVAIAWIRAARVALAVVPGDR